jgi:hypothetical protein
MASGELGPLLTRETDPLTFAVEVGANARLESVVPIGTTLALFIEFEFAWLVDINDWVMSHP